MNLLALQTVADGASRIEQVARTFGVDWPHLLAQMISFGIVCAVLYAFAYTPILEMLETRRRQIAKGLATAEKIRAERARIDIERQNVLLQADAEGKRLIEAARAAAARVEAEEIRKAQEAAEQILARARAAADRERLQLRAEVRAELGRLVVQTTAAATGKILTAEDHRRLAEETARQLAS
jgi:F-type H+-transporting ATPase subunit b